MAAPASTSNGVGGPSSNANDCLALLSKAVSSPDPADRKRSLSRLIKVLETSPGFLPILYGTFMGMLGGPVGSEGVVRRWVVEVMELAVCRGVVGPDQRLQRESPGSGHAVSRLIRLIPHPQSPCSQ